ncbi:hypothetical protein [Fictibacillus sp. S7]|nr:hypothetical protein [Fictibacillus sp. S7]
MSDSCFICSKHKGTIHTAGKMIYEDEYVYIGCERLKVHMEANLASGDE